MITFPNAKINLGLYVTQRRPDRYHDIESIFIPVGWNDILEIVPSETSTKNPRLFLSGNSLDCPVEKNLVYRIIQKLEQLHGTWLPVDVFLRKVIPDGAGLGGGSSDVAFTVKTLNEIYRLGMSDTLMEEIVMTVGSDCAFFIRNTPAFVTGRGEIMKPIVVPLNSWQILLVKPSQSISTAQAYAGITPKAPEFALQWAVKQPVSEWKDIIFNDFEPVAFNYFPFMKDIKRQLYDFGASFASMSGSGSAFFGLFEPSYDNLSEIKTFFDSKGYVTHSSILNF